MCLDEIRLTNNETRVHSSMPFCALSIDRMLARHMRTQTEHEVAFNVDDRVAQLLDLACTVTTRCLSRTSGEIHPWLNPQPAMRPLLVSTPYGGTRLEPSSHIQTASAHTSTKQPTTTLSQRTIQAEHYASTISAFLASISDAAGDETTEHPASTCH